MTKQMKIKEQENIIGMFPMMFFLLGLITQLFVSIIINSWASWLVMLIGLEIYFLFVIWFYYELSQYKLKLRGGIK